MFGVCGLLAACSGSPSESQVELDLEGAAVAACREAVGSTSRWSSTVRVEDDGWVVNIWRQGRPSGDPHYVCEAERDSAGSRGVAVAAVTPSPSN